MKTIIEKIFDVNTQSINVIEREMTPEEFSAWEADEARISLEAQAQTEMAAAKSALLERLGITEEEAKLLLS